jgi:hypothetical protein
VGGVGRVGGKRPPHPPTLPTLPTPLFWRDGNQMSVLGLDEAWDSAETIDPAISVVSLPALVGLKLITKVRTNRTERFG